MKTLYAIDIVNPFTKTVKEEGLQELLRRIMINGYFDKAGNNYYKVTWILKDNKIPETDLVVNFLNELNERKTLCKTIKFQLDKSIV